MPRDKRGWQVSPAPDGRDMPEQTPSGPPVHRRPTFLWFVLVLVAMIPAIFVMSSDLGSGLVYIAILLAVLFVAGVSWRAIRT